MIISDRQLRLNSLEMMLERQGQDCLVIYRGVIVDILDSVQDGGRWRRFMDVVKEYMQRVGVIGEDVRDRIERLRPLKV